MRPYDLALLWIVPAGILTWTWRRRPQIRWRATGVALGLVVVPASAGLFALYYLGPVPALFGLVGLPIALLHTNVLSEAAVRLGYSRIAARGGTNELVSLSLVGAVVWSVVYGVLGWLADVLSAGVRAQFAVDRRLNRTVTQN